MKRVVWGLLLLFQTSFSPQVWANPNTDLKYQIEGLSQQISDKDVDYGIVIQDLATGRTVYSRGSEQLLNPASNTKILTTLAALALLGPDFTFKTQLLGVPGDKGSLKTLALKGFGDPVFTHEALTQMVEQLKSKGIRRVEQVLVDGSFFDNEDFPGQMEGRQRDASFNCSVGSFSVDHNFMEIVVSPSSKVGAPATVETKPLLPNFPMTTDVSTIRNKGRIVVKNSGLSADDLTVSVKGSIALKSEPQTYRISIHRPLQLSALHLLQALKDQGIEAPAHAQIGMAPECSKVLVENASPPLGQILPEINKHSDNFMAEQVTKTLGAIFGGPPGSTQKGVRVILKKLRELGVKTEGVSLENGSGLTKNNRVAPQTLAQVLQKAYQDPKLRENFLPSLSILGVDGTLRRKFRHTDLVGRFIGKTGTLNGVSSLSGYAFPKNSEHSDPYIFSFIVNGRGKDFWKEKQTAQDILELLLND